MPDFLNNASIAAFLGAFAAFFLVALTDWRRNRRKKKILFRQITINKQLAEKKKQSIQNNLKALTDHNKIIPSPIMRFSIDDINRLKSETLDFLTTNEKLSLDAIIYTMEAIDGLIKSVENKVSRIDELRLIEPHKQDEPFALINSLPQDYNEISINLNRLVEMSEHFIEKRYDHILAKEY